MSREMGGRVVVVVLGATGTGKSKLGLQLAKAFNGEVLSADSMQVYRGLRIATNQMTAEECEGVPHHCLAFLDPLQAYQVQDFRNKALPIMERLLGQGRPPVVVGGTHYYIESLLWDLLVDVAVGQVTPESAPVGLSARRDLLLQELDFLQLSGAFSESDAESLRAQVQDPLSQGLVRELVREQDEEDDGLWQEAAERLEAEERLEAAERRLEATHPDPARLANRRLHARLRELDPDRAAQLHFNDVRKVTRSLEVLARSGIRHSELLRRQHEAAGGSQIGGPLRYPGRTAVLWLNAQQEVLDKRLDERVDEMMKQGLLEELEDFHSLYAHFNTSPPYTRGIFQTIGLKEFDPYLTLEDKKSEAGQAKLAECVEALKLATRRYARKQIKWIRNRFLRAHLREVPPVYQLDGTDVGEWDKQVLAPATAIVRHFLGLTEAGDVVPEPLPRIVSNVNHTKVERLCKTCMRIFIGDLQWEIHLKSKKHQAMVKKKKKEEE